MPRNDEKVILSLLPLFHFPSIAYESAERSFCKKKSSDSLQESIVNNLGKSVEASHFRLHEPKRERFMILSHPSIWAE